jgi:hypothetical protein
MGGERIFGAGMVAIVTFQFVLPNRIACIGVM